MQDLGYLEHELQSCNGRLDELALFGPTQIVTQEAAHILSGICHGLKHAANANPHVVTHRLRGADRYSKFLYDMVRDRDLLLALSRLFGVPLIPHPLRDAAVQVNYYSQEQESLAKWHCDGMNYVLTILVTPQDDFIGGEFMYFHGHRNRFGALEVDRDPNVRVIPFRKLGDTLFTRGSRVFHAVNPVTQGQRITLVLSFFCPYLAHDDSNRFWHSAPDDGLFTTVRNWLNFRVPLREPSYYFRLVNAPMITWLGLEN